MAKKKDDLEEANDILIRNCVAAGNMEPFIFVQFVRDVKAIYFFQDGIYSLDKTER